MADKTERQRLLKQINILTSLIQNAKQQKADDASATMSTSSSQLSSGNVRQHNLCHKQHQGSSTFTRTNPTPPVLPHCTQAQGRKKFDSCTSSSAQSSKFVQQQLQQHGYNMTAGNSTKAMPKVSEINSLKNPRASIKKSLLKSESTDLVNAPKISVSSTSENPVHGATAVISTVQCTNTNRDQMPSKTVIRVKCSSPSIKPTHLSFGIIGKYSTSSLSANAKTPQFKHTQLKAIKTGKPEKPLPLEQNSSFSSVKPHVHHASSTVSSHKDQLAYKTAQVVAARQTMQSNIDSLKSNLAKLAAAKQKKKNSSSLALKCGKSEIKSSARADENCNGKPAVMSGLQKAALFKESSSEEVKTATSDFNQGTKSCKNLSEIKSSGSHPHNIISKCSNKSTTNHSCGTTYNKEAGLQLLRRQADQTMGTTRQLFTSSSVTTASSAESEQDSAQTHCSRPSRSSAKADLKKELEATEEKLICMRKKMGVMLKESPEKATQCKNTLNMSSQHQTADLVSLSVSVAMHGSLSKHHEVAVKQSTMCGSPTVSGGKLTPFPNRRSLKWTPAKSAVLNSSERVLVVGNSQSLRSSQKNLTRAKLSGQGQSEARISQSILTHAKINRNAQRGKRSRYSLVRNSGSSAVSRWKESSSDAAVSQKKLRSHVSEPFIGRYKLQRSISNSPKVSKSGRNLTGRVTVTSRYKLMKTGLRDVPCSQTYSVGGSLPGTAIQRAAKYIKTKYHLRKVPVYGSAQNSAASQRQTLLSETYYRRAKNLHQSHLYTRKTRRRKYSTASYTNRSSFQGAFYMHSTGARSQFRNRHTRGRNIAASFYGGCWNRRQNPYYSPNWWWKQQQMKKNLFQQYSWRHRTKVALAWKRQQNGYNRLMMHGYNQRSVKTYSRIEQHQKRLLLKRLQWMKKYSFSRQQTRRQDRSPTKSKFQYQKQEHLVMINGILYKSNSRRLTKTSASSTSCATKSNTTTSAAAASNSESRLNGSFVVRSVKQSKMQTVTVRGVRFKMDGRGTRLQRVQSNTKQGTDKIAAVSRVDVGGTTYVQTKEGILEKISDSQTRSVVSRVKQRSIALAAAKFKKDNKKGKKKSCLFFSRFGKCSRGEKCPFVHDPEKIAVCTRFLRGTCKVEDCPFSHKVSKEKMPVCAFFLRGVCTHEDCPYLHVKVSHGAEVCQDFVMGFCPLADKCPKVHTLTCPHFAKTGTCPDGKKCHMLHRRLRMARKPRTKSSASSACEDSGARLPSNKAKQTAHGCQQTQPEDGSPPPQKRFKPNTDQASQQVVSSDGDVPVQRPTKTLNSGEREAQRESSPRSDKATGFRRFHAELKDSLPQLAQLPAFISLADYSLEESPSRTVDVTRTHKPVISNNGNGLQIKPRI